MENYGKTIAALRKEKNLTQQELGQMLNVTPQAVSKWENDQSQPPVDTFFDMCKLFEISPDEFRRRAEGEQAEPSEKTEQSETIIEPEAEIKEETAQADCITPTALPAVEVAPIQETPVVREAPAYREKKLSIGFLIVMILAIAAGLATSISLMVVLQIDEIGPALIVFLIGYFVFSFFILIGHESVVWDCFLGALCKSVNLPGIIFTLDINGILFLIVYKFIIAPIVTVVVWLAFVIGGFIISLVMAGFVFPFRIPTIYRETFGGKIPKKKDYSIHRKKKSKKV